MNEIKQREKTPTGRSKKIMYKEEREIERLVKQRIPLNEIMRLTGLTYNQTSMFIRETLGIRYYRQERPKKEKKQKGAPDIDPIDRDAILMKLGETNALLSMIHTELVKIRSPNISIEDARREVKE